MINQAVWLRSGLCHKRAGTNAVLGQALGNLLSNAIKYTPPGGTVTISANVENGLTAIHVEDTGAGIAQDEQALVFTPFYRGGADGRFPQGMGLGLTIARDLVMAHGGQIEVHSTPAKGSRFTILLLLSPGRGGPLAPRKRTELGGSGGNQ